MNGTRMCKFEDCERASRKRGWCERHYVQWSKGIPLFNRPSDSSRFWSKVDKSGECWLWTESMNQGYGIFWVKPGKVFSHRFAYQERYGNVIDGIMLDHICHTTACVRPDHLRPVRSKQNQENRISVAKNNTSGYRGVSWSEKRGGWIAGAISGGRKRYAGIHPTAALAGEAARLLRIELFTHNDIDRGLYVPNETKDAA